MNIENIPPAIGWTIVVVIIVAPSLIKLVSNLYKGWRIRQVIKNTPGPLLGVIYPDRFNTPTNEDTGR